MSRKAYKVVESNCVSNINSCIAGKEMTFGGEDGFLEQDNLVTKERPKILVSKNCPHPNVPKPAMTQRKLYRNVSVPELRKEDVNQIEMETKESQEINRKRLTKNRILSPTPKILAILEPQHKFRRKTVAVSPHAAQQTSKFMISSMSSNNLNNSNDNQVSGFGGGTNDFKFAKINPNNFTGKKEKIKAILDSKRIKHIQPSSGKISLLTSPKEFTLIKNPFKQAKFPSLERKVRVEERRQELTVYSLKPISPELSVTSTKCKHLKNNLLLVFSSLDSAKKENIIFEEAKHEPPQENKKLNRIDLARESLIKFIRECKISNSHCT